MYTLNLRPGKLLSLDPSHITITSNINDFFIHYMLRLTNNFEIRSKWYMTIIFTKYETYTAHTAPEVESSMMYTTDQIWHMVYQALIMNTHSCYLRGNIQYDIRLSTWKLHRDLGWEISMMHSVERLRIYSVLGCSTSTVYLKLRLVCICYFQIYEITCLPHTKISQVYAYIRTTQTPHTRAP